MYSVFLACFLFALSGCTKYKKSLFDSESQLYQNYKYNYCFKVLPGYEVIGRDEIKKISNFQMPWDIKEAIYNEEASIMIGFCIKRFGRNIDRLELIRLMKETDKEELKEEFSIKGQDVDVFFYRDYLLAQTTIESDASELNVIFAVTVYQVEYPSQKGYSFMVIAISPDSGMEEVKADIKEYLDGLKYDVFTFGERVVEE